MSYNAGTSDGDRFFDARYGNSLIDLPNLTTLAANTRGYTTYVRAFENGNNRVNLPKLTGISDNSVGMYVEGAGSHIDLPLLASWNGRSPVSGRTSSMEARTNGVIDARALVTRQNVDVVEQSGGNVILPGEMAAATLSLGAALSGEYGEDRDGIVNAANDAVWRDNLGRETHIADFGRLNDLQSTAANQPALSSGQFSGLAAAFDLALLDWGVRSFNDRPIHEGRHRLFQTENTALAALTSEERLLAVPKPLLSIQQISSDELALSEPNGSASYIDVALADLEEFGGEFVQTDLLRA